MNHYGWQDLLPALAGGLLIGLATALLLLGTGRIAGISGLFGRVLSGRPGAVPLAFLGGLVAAPWLLRLFQPLPLGASLAEPRWGLLIFAGLLVGIGTQLSNGCTSGHGVCGLGNLSRRSLVAVVVFMAVAIVTATLGFGALR